jgi:Mrp family chromosome partitioning ATPase
MLRDEASFDLVEPARPPEEPLPSGRKLVVAGGMVLGTGAGIFLALLLELLDPAVRSRRDALDLTDCDRVWEFQRVPPGEHSVIDTRSPAEPVATLFRRLVNELESRLDEAQWRCLAITSIEAGSGRSLAATNLAQAIAMKEYSVILIDADLRDSAGPRPSHLFGLPEDRPGLREALRDEAILPDLLSATETRGLHLLGPGTPPKQEDAGGEALMALGGRQMRSVVKSLKQTGRHVLYDLPPLTAQETVVEAATAVGNLMIVVRSGQTRRDELKEISEMLREREIDVRVVLLTDVPAEVLSGKPVFEHQRPKRRGRANGRAESIEPTLGTNA